jgi:hypothetical protein
MLAWTLFIACVDVAEGPPAYTGHNDEPEVSGPADMWVLVHPTDAPALGTGIFRLQADTTLDAQRVSGPILVPGRLISPHAIADTGSALLVGGFTGDPTPQFSDDRSVFRLAYDGTELASYLNVGCEGLAFDEGIVYVANGSVVELVSEDWEPIDEIWLDDIIQDIAVDGRRLYRLMNGSPDVIDALDLDFPADPMVVVAPGATFSNEGYAMMVWGDELLVADHDIDGNFLRHLDAETGAPTGITRIAIDGWITAIGAVTPTTVAW